MSNDPTPLHVLIQQPALPKYRVPVFAELAKRPGLSVRVSYGVVPELTNAEPDGFVADRAPARAARLAGREIQWSDAQWRGASRSVCDVLVLTWNLNYASLVPGLLRARASGVGTVLWGHGFSKVDAGWRSWPRRNVTRLASAVLFYSPDVARRNIEAGLDAKKVFTAINALDDRPIRAARDAMLAAPERVAAHRAALAPGGGPVLLFVSRLTPKARVDLLLEAVRRLAPARPGLRLVVVGGGDLDHYRDLATKLGVSEQVNFVGPVYGEEQLAPYFLAADLFVYPSRGGLSFIHAMGYGVPVLTDDAFHLHGPEVQTLRDAGAGEFYRHEDADSLATSVAALLDAPERRRAMSDAGRRCVDQVCNLRSMVDGFEAAIRYAARRR